MSIGEWFFRRIRAGEPVKEPTQEQFFQQDSINETPGKAIVREGIQNSLDERLDEDNTVRVRIMVESPDSCPEAMGILLNDELQHHIREQGNGLVQNDLPAKNDRFRFLVFEDFNTNGLKGDISSPVAEIGVENNFYNFFRAVGGTEKEKGKRGKWGVGKHTFWMASRINTVFCFTVRKEKPETLFMGKTILKSHPKNGGTRKEYQDGYYGTPQENEFCLPITGNDAFEIASAFALRRKTESGLSVIVPWLAKEIKQNQIFNSIIEDYFYPILTGDLVVSARHDGDEVELRADTIADYASGRIKTLAALAEDLIDGSAKVHTVRPENPACPDWNREMFDEDLLNTLVQDYADGGKIFLQVEVKITPKNESRQTGQFKIAIVRTDDDEKEKPVFIREGITIPDVSTRKEKEVVALVVADGGPLAEFLGASENPSHTVWQAELVKNNYTHAPKMLRFVQDSVRNIINILSSANKEKDITLLADIFPAEESGGKKKNGGDKPEPPKQNPRKCEIHYTPEGFVVRPGEAKIPANSVLVVNAAYATRGNSLAKYSKDDFALESGNFSVDDKGLEEIALSGNEIRAHIINDDFSLRVIGFDPNRDLYVKANVLNSEEED